MQNLDTDQISDGPGCTSDESLFVLSRGGALERWLRPVEAVWGGARGGRARRPGGAGGGSPSNTQHE
ncbi:hypothetical protein ACFVZL_06895, partial [Streptomyces sp. NPDC058320]|uniref:hypothetical protein n=1 Tax=Streptomyces sp. NPDC058320 TaxID=3346444 RepID=UPI0036F11A04